MRGVWVARYGGRLLAVSRHFANVVAEVALYDGSAGPVEFTIGWLSDEDAAAAGVPMELVEVSDAHEWAHR